MFEPHPARLSPPRTSHKPGSFAFARDSAALRGSPADDQPFASPFRFFAKPLLARGAFAERPTKREQREPAKETASHEQVLNARKMGTLESVFFQLDRRISMMIDIQLASQLPLARSSENP